MARYSCDGPKWYFTRKEIEENSPSRGDGIDLKKETYLRKSYCTFLQDLGMRLKVPQVTIATAVVFCHRFFLHQSHAKNDSKTIATVCMFLAGKVEESPRPLKDVILVSYEIIHKRDPAAIQRIKKKEVYEQQKELILIGENVVLTALGFDLNVHHPYKPLVDAIKNFKVAQNALAQVAWNFVNDGLRTSLCLQFKPQHIAAGAIFLAAKFLKVKLLNEGDKVWWQDFDVTPRQLEDVSNQMLELYEQNRAGQLSHGNEGSTCTVTNQTVGENSNATSTSPNMEPVSCSRTSRDGEALRDHGRYKPRNDAARESGTINENNLIERKLEDGANLAGEDEKLKQERRRGWSRPEVDLEKAEEGDLSSLDEHEVSSSKLSNYRGRELEGMRQRDFHHPDHLERDWKRQRF